MSASALLGDSSPRLPAADRLRMTMAMELFYYFLIILNLVQAALPPFLTWFKSKP
jgi:hypothetical protein